MYHALINALSAHMIHINLNTVFYTDGEHSPVKTIYIKYYMKNQQSVNHSVCYCSMKNLQSVNHSVCYCSMKNQLFYEKSTVSQPFCLLLFYEKSTVNSSVCYCSMKNQQSTVLSVTVLWKINSQSTILSVTVSRGRTFDERWTPLIPMKRNVTPPPPPHSPRPLLPDPQHPLPIWLHAVQP